MDKYGDFYGEGVNYRRLFLLFVLFLVSYFFWIGDDASALVENSYQEAATSLQTRHSLQEKYLGKIN